MTSHRKNLLFIPGPVTVSEPVLAAMSKPLIDHRGAAFAALLERVMRGMQSIYGTKEPVYFLGSSGTGALEATLVSLFSPGDRLLSCPLGSFGKRYANIARTYGCEVDMIESEPGHALDAQKLAAALGADTQKKYAGILLTHNETSTGVQQDMAALSKAIGNHGAITLVDSVSGLGAGDFRMDDWGYDAVVTASQKVLAAPPGVAMVALSGRATKRLKESKIPSFYFSLSKAMEFADLGQTPWTPPVSIFFALDAALKAYHNEGAHRIWNRHAMYARAIRSAVEALGFEVFSDRSAHSDTVVAVKAMPGMDVAALLKKLRVERGVSLSGGQLELKGKIFRVGTMGDVSQTDVLGMLGALEMAMIEQELPVHVGKGVQAALRVFLEMDAGTKPGDGQKSGVQTAEQTMAVPS